MTDRDVRPVDGVGLCWGSLPGANMSELAELAARHGFSEISVRPAQFPAGDNEVAAIQKRLDSLGVTVGVIDGLMTYLPGSAKPEDVRPDWRELMVTVEDCLRTAEGCHARTINVAHFLGDPQVDRDAVADALRRLADRAADIGVRISMEFIPGTGVPDLPAALDIVGRADHPGVGVLFDTWHFLRSGGTGEQLAALRPGQLFEAQISDRVQPAPDEQYVPMAGRLPPGEGEAPLVEMVRAVRAVAPDVVLGVEVFKSEYADPDNTVAHLAATTRTVLSSAFG